MYSLQRAVMLWNWAVSLRILWWQHLMALRAMPASALGQGWQVLKLHLCAMRRRVRQDAEVPLVPSSSCLFHASENGAVQADGLILRRFERALQAWDVAGLSEELLKVTMAHGLPCRRGGRMVREKDLRPPEMVRKHAACQ